MDAIPTLRTRSLPALCLCQNFLQVIRILRLRRKFKIFPKMSSSASRVLLGFVNLGQQKLQQGLVVLPVNRFGLQSSLFRFVQLVEIEIGNRAEEIGIGVVYR